MSHLLINHITLKQYVCWKLACCHLGIPEALLEISGKGAG